MLIRALLTGLCLTLALPVEAEIEKFAIPGENGMSFIWWPKLSPLEGWAHDRRSSVSYSINALAPVGQSFNSAETVMYAKAVFKPRMPEAKSLEMLIEHDKQDFLRNSPGVVISTAPALTTADGRKVVSFKFTPRSEGNWERVSYLEEGEFYLVFTVSSRTQQGIAASENAYETLIAKYREKP